MIGLSHLKHVAGHERLHALVERLASSYRGYLPWTDETPDVKTRLALIEDCVKAADKAVAEQAKLIEALELAMRELYCIANEKTIQGAYEFEPDAAVLKHFASEALKSILALIGKGEGK